MRKAALIREKSQPVTEPEEAAVAVEEAAQNGELPAKEG